MMDKALTLKGMIEGSGCTPRTVRYYEREGLLRASRTGGGHRLFAPIELERLRLVIQLREAGWGLDEVTEFLAVRDRPSTDVEAWTRFDHLIALHISRLERKIEILAQLRADLGRTAELLPVCRECVQPADTAGAGLDGARRDCQQCERLPAIGALPASFRLAWRGRELDDVRFDEPAADVLGDGAVEPTDAEPAQAEPAQAEPTEVEPTEVEPAEVEPTEVEPTDVEPADVEPADVEPAEVEVTRSRAAQERRR